MATFNIEDLQRSTVVDQDGDKVGKVGQVYLDDANGQPNWVTVNIGLFGANETFIPLDEASQNGDEVRVPYTKDFIKDAPNLGADAHVDEGQEDELYRYYGLQGGDTVRDAQVGTAGTAGTAGTVGAAGTAGAATGVAGADVHQGDRRDDRLDADRKAAAAGAAGTGRGVDDDANSVVRHEEEVHVGTQRVQTGRARLRKHVVHDTRTVEVPVEREEVEVVREPIVDGETGGTLTDGEAEVTLSEERPVVEKDVVAKERVGLDKNVVRDQEAVQTDVAHEEVEIERDADGRLDADRRGNDRNDRI